MANNEKLRVWWRPQLDVSKTFYINVDSPEEGWKLLQVLMVYDLYQLYQAIKPDFYNIGCLEYFDEEEQEWFDWFN